MPKLEYAYEVYPSNFYLLPEQRRNALVDNFRAFLNALSSDLKITVIRNERPVEIGDERIVTSYYRFFMESAEAIDHLLDASGIRFQPLAEAPVLEPVKVFAKHMESAACSRLFSPKTSMYSPFRSFAPPSPKRTFNGLHIISDV